MQAAWFNDDTEHVAFRLKLHPIELGHLFLLRDFQSPYLIDSGYSTATKHDAMLFAFVMCSNYERALARLASPLSGFWMRVYRWISRKCDFDVENAKIVAFTQDQHQHLKMAFHMSDSNKWDSEAPLEYSLLTSSMTELNMSRHEAFRTPIRMLQNMLAIRATQTGPASILTEKQIRVIDRIKRIGKEALN